MGGPTFAVITDSEPSNPGTRFLLGPSRALCFRPPSVTAWASCPMGR